MINPIARMRTHIVPYIILVSITTAVYASSLDHDFLVNWDDAKYVTVNEAVKGLSADHIKSAFSTIYVGNYAPLHIVSYMMDYSLWGMKASGFIATSILLHTLNGLLLYSILTRLSWGRISTLASSYIFLLHPVQVESVVWISQRKNPLSMFFFLIAFFLYILYKENRSGYGKTCYFLSILFFICSVLSKPVTVIFPALIFLYDVCFKARTSNKYTYQDKLPYILISIVTAVVAIFSQTPEFDGGRTSYHGGNIWATVITMLPIFVNYLIMLLYPLNLNVIYPPVIRNEFDITVVLSLLVLVSLSVFAVYLFRKQRETFFWLAVFFLGILPVSQVVPLVTLMNDRYLYFPLLGAAPLAVAGVGRVAMVPAAFVRQTVLVISCLILLFIPFLSVERAAVWQNSLTLWSDATRKAPQSAEAWRGLGVACQSYGNTEEAIKAYLQAIKYAPLDHISLHNLGLIYTNKMELGVARAYLQELVKANPGYVDGHISLGFCLLRAGDFTLAEKHANRALALDPENSRASALKEKVNFTRTIIKNR